MEAMVNAAAVATKVTITVVRAQSRWCLVRASASSETGDLTQAAFVSVFVMLSGLNV